MNTKKEMPIGVFDSGMGGISTLQALCKVMPNEHFLYFGDSANAPYGEKTENEIKDLALRAAEFLLEKGIKELVIACNTATSAAVKELRRELSIPVIGIEPAVKPAGEAVEDGIMLVMATPATIRQEKLRLLIAKYGKNVEQLPCPGLMEFVERFEFSGERLAAYLEELLLPYRSRKIEACVLGCTHYPFLKEEISKALPGVRLFDGNEGTARQARRILAEADLLNEMGEGKIEFFSSAGPREVERMKVLFNEQIC